MRGKHLLVVERDRNVRQLWRVWFEQLGAYVHSYSSATAALADDRAIRTAHAVITGFALEAMFNGATLIRALRARRPVLPAVIITGVPLDEVACALGAEENVTLIAKPVPLEHLQNHLNRLGIPGGSNS